MKWSHNESYSQPEKNIYLKKIGVQLVWKEDEKNVELTKVCCIIYIYIFK